MIPLFNSAQVREADKYAINKLGIPSILLMENAARSIYELIDKNFSGELVEKKAAILCGKGNNGGDGFALTRNFLINGFSVIVISIGAEKELKGDALLNYIILKKTAAVNKNLSLVNYKGVNSIKKAAGCDIIVDALLGTGAYCPLKEPYNTIIKYVNTLDAVKVAVDIPTGLNVDTGYGETVFEADLTVSLAEFKAGLFYSKGYKFAGKVEKGSIGLGKEYFDSLNVENYLIEPEDVFTFLPEKEPDAYKYSAGKVLVIAGSRNFTGAAFLTTNAVMKSGAGACILAFPESIKEIALQNLKMPTVFGYEDNGRGCLTEDSVDSLMEKIEWADAVALGPGIGREEETLAAVRKLIKKGKNKRFIIDADALYALAGKEYTKIDLSGMILTPHHKEFADMLGIELKELEENMPANGKDFAVKNKCYLVLKGAPTITFTPNGDAIINSTGNPGMAKFGTGDVLTGFTAGMAAQHITAEEAVLASVYIHSLAADLLINEKTVYGMTSTDILENLPYAIKFIFDTFSPVS